MQSFSFNRKENILIPEVNNFRPFTDKNGHEVSGDNLLKSMAKIVEKWETKNKIPVPIADQKFVAWIKQAKIMLDSGMSSDEIFKRTLVRMN